MNLLVEVTDIKTFDGENVSRGTGESREFKYQKLWIHIPGEPHPSKNKRVITKEAPTLPVGFYVFDVSKCFSDWNWSRVNLSTRHLVPATAEQIAAFRGVKKAA